MNAPQAGGANLADYVINHRYAGAPHDQIVWWGRYFDSGFSNQTGSWQGNGESQALHNAVAAYANPTGGFAWVAPLASPYNPTNINGSYTDGVNAGNYVGGRIAQALNYPWLNLPGNHWLNVYLDVEPNAATNVNFLNGWAAAVNGYNINNVLPLYACPYVNPWRTNASIVGQAGTWYGAWGQQPTGCAYWPCTSPGPAWDVAGMPNIPTNLWQYGEQTACTPCTSNVVVDLDYTYPGVQGSYGYGMCDNMLYIP